MYQDDQPIRADWAKTIRSLTLLIIVTLMFEGLVLAQGGTFSQPGAGSRRGFTLYGDLKVADSQAADPQRSSIYDVILYNRGNEVVSRQRIGNGNRYRFDNIFNGDYYLAVEYENAEIARIPILISTNSTQDIRQDLEFMWKARATVGNAGVTDAANAYARSSQTNSLYQKASKEIAAKDFALLHHPEVSGCGGPKRFSGVDGSRDGLLCEKDLEAAENSYTSAIAAKPDHIAALVSLGRVRLARKNNEGAVEPLEAALKADPKSAAANYFLGEAYLALKKGSKAVGYLNAALAIDPIGMADAHLRLGSLYNLAGYKDRAAAEYEQFLTKKPDYPERKKLEEYIQANKPKTDPPKP